MLLVVVVSSCTVSVELIFALHFHSGDFYLAHSISRLRIDKHTDSGCVLWKTTCFCIDGTDHRCCDVVHVDNDKVHVREILLPHETQRRKKQYNLDRRVAFVFSLPNADSIVLVRFEMSKHWW